MAYFLETDSAFPVPRPKIAIARDGLSSLGTPCLSPALLSADRTKMTAAADLMWPDDELMPSPQDNPRLFGFDTPVYRQFNI